LQEISAKKDEWDRLDTVVVAVSSKELPSENGVPQRPKELKDSAIELLSDPDHTNARRYHSFDDFEELELHSTSLIDKKGRVYWAHYGGDPFTNLSFLTKQLERMNELAKTDTLAVSAPAAAK